MAINWAGGLDRLICIFFPPRCVICGEVTYYEDLCCEGCTYIPYGLIDLENNSALSAAAAPIAYEGDARRAIWEIKKYPDKRIAAYLGQKMAETVRESWSMKFDCIVPVPINPMKLAKRKFNQAGLLADVVGAELGIPVRSDILGRKDITAVQHDLSEKERRENARKSFYLSASDIKDMTILLVDDVYTTGSTLNICAELLLNAGAAALYSIAAMKTQFAVGSRGEIYE